MEAEVKNLVTGHRNNGISVSTKMMIARWLHVASVMLEETWNVIHARGTRCAWKCFINTLDGPADFVISRT
jgi:hypothetical protein